ncbi:MAG: hypothetical protein LAO51_04545 [Acidobacteriia bacterium]|nr:hypothetical protein [Terriglobia bacterium]
MEQGVTQATGWIVATPHAWTFIAIWAVVVLAYGIWRSRGEATQDTIRPSGPTG